MNNIVKSLGRSVSYPHTVCLQIVDNTHAKFYHRISNRPADQLISHLLSKLHCISCHCVAGEIPRHTGNRYA